MNVTQKFSQIAAAAAEKETNANEVLSQRDQLFKKNIEPALIKRGANPAAIETAKQRWNAQTDQVMQTAGLIPKAGQNQRGFEKDKRAERAIEKSAKTGSALPIIGETIKSTAETVGNLVGQGTGSVIEGAGRFLNDLGENEKGTFFDGMANYGADLRKVYEESASSMQRGQQAGQHGKVTQLATGAVQSVPALVAPFGAAKGVAGAVGFVGKKAAIPSLVAAAPYAGLAAGVGAGHTQNYGEVRRSATQNLERDFPTWEKLQGNPLYEQKLSQAIDSGVSINQARQAAHAATLDELSEGAADKYGTAMTAIDFIAPSGAALGSGLIKNNPTGIVAKTLTGGVNKKLVQQQMNNAPRVGLAKLVPDVSITANKAAATMVGKQALEEGLQGGIGNYGGQAASANIGGQAVDWKQVGQSALEEGLMGAVMGGGMQTATGQTPTKQAKAVADDLRKQTNALRREEAQARQELQEATYNGNQEAIISAEKNLQGVHSMAQELEAAYSQYGVDTPYFVSSMSQMAQTNAQQQEAANAQAGANQEQPEAAPVDPVDPTQPQATPMPAQPVAPVNTSQAKITNLVMQSVSSGLITPDEANAIQSDPLHGEIFTLASSGDAAAAHNVVMNAASMGNIDFDQAQSLIQSIDRYSNLGKQKASLAGIVNNHVQAMAPQPLEQPVQQQLSPETPQPQTQAQQIDGAFKGLTGGLGYSFLKKAAELVAKGENPVYARPDSIAAAKKNPNYHVVENADGSVSVVGVLDPETQQWVGVPPQGTEQAPALNDFGYTPSDAQAAGPDGMLSDFDEGNFVEPISPADELAALAETEGQQQPDTVEVAQGAEELEQVIAGEPEAPANDPVIEPVEPQPLVEKNEVPLAPVTPQEAPKPDHSQPKTFSNQTKANRYVNDNGLTDTHEVVEDDGMFEVRPKTAEPEQAEDTTSFADKIRDAHLNNPNAKAGLINAEINKGRPRAEVLKEVQDIVASIQKPEAKPDQKEEKPKGKMKIEDVRTYYTKSGQVGARIQKLTHADGRISYNYNGKWGAGSVDPKSMQEDEDYWKSHHKGYTVVEANSTAENPDKNDQSASKKVTSQEEKPQAEQKTSGKAEQKNDTPNAMQDGDIGRVSDGKPFENKQAANILLKKRGYADTHEIVQIAPSKFVFRKKAEKIEDAPKPEPKAPAKEEKPKGRTLIGKNKKGDDVYEDERGVRSYYDPLGAFITESVSITPNGIEFGDKRDWRYEVLSEEELAKNEQLSKAHDELKAVQKESIDWGNTDAVIQHYEKERDALLKMANLIDDKSSEKYYKEEAKKVEDTISEHQKQREGQETRDSNTDLQAALKAYHDAREAPMPKGNERAKYYNTIIQTIDNLIKVDPHNAFIWQDQKKKYEESLGKYSKPAETTPAKQESDDVQQLDQTSTRTLETAPTEDVPGVRTQGDSTEETGRSSRTNVPGSRSTGTTGNDTGRSLADDTREVSIPAGRNDSNEGLDPQQAVVAKNAPVDAFVIDEKEIGQGGKKTKFKANIEAIKVIKQLEAEQRPATKAEQKTLSKFVGWGGLPEAFKREDGSISTGWTKEVAELESLLTKEEMKAAVDSSIAAHYTSPEIVKALWQAVENFGFKQGRVLEPAVGVGNFFGLMPKAMRKASNLYAVELDNITGAVAKHLYPEANVKAPMGFQDYQTIDNYFDVAIGNPPFSSITINDRVRPGINGFSLHNYFFAKSIDSVKPNGVLAMVVTNRFLDKMGDKERAYIAERAELVGAIRLPNDAFLSNAGTQVTTDIIFLRKKAEGEGKVGENWLDVKNYTDKDGNTVPLNEYFVRHPENMLGDFGAYGSMYKDGEPALIKRDNQDTQQLLSEAIARLPKDVFKAEASNFEETRQAVIRDISKVKVGSKFVNSDGQVHERLPDVMGDQRSQVIEFTNDKARDRVVGMISIADHLANVRTLQLDKNSTDKQIEAARKDLNKAYDAFVKEHGFINNDTNKRLMRDDPNWAQLAALENNYDRGVSAQVAKSTGQKFRKPSAEKAAIFSKRTQVPIAQVESVSNAQDALTESLNRHGYVNLQTMQELYQGKSESEIVAELGDLVFNDPIDGYTVRDQYLSGNVKKKLAIAQEYAQQDPQYERNVRALEKVIPADIEALDIDVKIGSHWIPANHMADFVSFVTGSPNAQAEYTRILNKWEINPTGITPTAEATYSTSRVDTRTILNHAINGTKPTVYDRYSDGTSVINQEATLEAASRVEMVKSAWKDWIWENDARRENIERIYNDVFNTTVNREYDGSHLVFHGMNSGIELRPHQKNAVWRSVQSKATLYDHTVGAGKTFTVIAAAMEMRRMGIANKPLIVVPNHLVGQWANDFVLLYPNANILAATKKDFEKANRKKFIAKMANGDYDAIIIAHSSFGKISISPEQEQSFIDREIAEIMEFEASLRRNKQDRSRNAKAVAKRRLALEERKKNLLNRDNKDTDNIYWHELGIDSVMLDEAHEFKNLEFNTSMQNVAGLGTGKGSQKAKDLFAKIQIMQGSNPKSKVIFATGTPISNTMAEMFTMQRYLDWDNLKERGINHFDAWAKVFGEVVSDWELSPSGKYKLTNRFAKFVNMPELMQGYLSFGDVMNRDDINAQLAREGKTLGTPKIKGNKPQNIVVERSDAQADFIGVPSVDENGNETYPEGSLVWRSENLPRKPEKGADNMLKIMGDARKAALDMRLIDPMAEDYEGSKVNTAVNSIYETYKKWNVKKGTQLVFCDLSTPKGAVAAEKARIEQLVKLADDGDEAAQAELDKLSPDELSALDSEFSVYDDVKAKLIAKGMKESEIAFIHDAKTELQKQELFEKVKRGDIRVLMGSTAKMGAGMNVQNKLVALHHLDAPWRPSDLEQREGRIIRQGNEFYKADPNGFEIEINRYATKQTLDSRMWQTIESKAKFIEQVRKGAGTTRVVEDIAGEAANAAEMKAASSGDPRILEEMDLRKQIKELEDDKTSFDRGVHRTKAIIKSLESDNAYLNRKLDSLEKDNQIKQPEKFVYENGRTKVKQDDKGARDSIGEAFKEGINEALAKSRTQDLGVLNGFKIQAAPGHFSGVANISIQGKGDETSLGSYSIIDSSPVGLVQKILNYLKSIPELVKKHQSELLTNQEQIPQLQKKIQESKWDKGDQLRELKSKHMALIDELKPKKKEAPAEEGNQEKRASRRSGAGAGSTPAQVRRSLVERFGKDAVEQLEQSGQLTIVPTYNEPGVEGFAENGRVTLVADAITPENIVPVFLHEMGGHVGLQGVLKPQAYENLMKDFNRLVEVGNPEALEAKRLAERESDAAVQADEYLPYLITIASQKQANMNAAQRFVNRIVSAIKAWAVDKLGVSLSLNANDVVALAERMIKQIPKHTPPTGGKKSTGKALNKNSSIARPDYNFSIASLWTSLAKDNDAFEKPISTEKDLKAISLELSDRFTIEEFTPKNQSQTQAWILTNEDGRTVKVFRSKEEVWVDISNFDTGSGGKDIYNIVANYAYSNNLKFTGDPNGLSGRGMTRRLENMLTSAVKFGTTRHLKPHPKQIEGNDLVIGMNWIDGDDINNLEQLMFASYNTIKTNYPEIESIRYNPEKDIFEGIPTGRLANKTSKSVKQEFTRSDIALLVRKARSSPIKLSAEFTPTAGVTTLERAILIHSYLTGTAKNRLDIKERLSTLGSNRLTGSNAILFSRKDSSPSRRYSKTSNPASLPKSQQKQIFNNIAQTALGEQVLLNAERSKTISKQTLNLFQTMLHKALTDESGDFKKTFDLVQGKINHVTFTSSLSQDMAPSILTKLEQFSDYKKEAVRVGRHLASSLTGGKVQRTKVDQDIDKIGEFMFENTLSGQGKRHTDAELQQLGYDKDQIGIYNEIRNAIDVSLDNFAATTFNNIYKHLGGTSDEILGLSARSLSMSDHRTEILNLINSLVNADPAKAEAGKEAIAAVDKVYKRLGELKDEGYVPLMRFGKYFFRVVNPATGEVAYRQHFESEAERNMAAKNFDPANIPPGYTLESSQLNELEYKMFQGVSPETVALFAKEAGLPIGDAEKAYIQHAIRDNHALKRLLKRQGIKGFDSDIKRVLAAFVMSNARYAANQTYNPIIDESITEIKDPAFQEDAVRLRDYSLDTQEELSGFKNFAFVWYMGYSFMFGLVNLTQPFLQSMPFLMQYSKDWNVTGRAFLKAVETWRKGTGSMPAKYQKYYEQAQREGHLDPQNTWMMQGLERGKSGLGAGVWQLISHSSGLFAQASETVNRRTSLFAALDVAESLGDKRLKELGFKDAYDFAIRTIQETQGIYNKGNRPRVARGNVGSILMMYKQFMIAYIEQMVRMQRSGLWGGEDDEFKKKMAAMVGFGVSKSVLIMLGILFGLSGGTGLPFVRDILDVVETAGGVVGKPFNTEREIQIALHDALGDTIGAAATTILMDGAINLNPLTDVKGRMGMGDLIPATAYFSPATPERQKSDELANIAGAAGGLLGKAKEAMEFAQIGSYGMAAIQLAPKAVTSGLQGGWAATTGEYRNMKTGVVTNRATPLDGIVKMLDAQPANIAKEGRVRGLEAKDKAIQQYENKRWKERYVAALESGERDQIRSIRNEISEYNRQNPRYPITFNQKRAETNYEKSNQSWQEKRKGQKGLEWMDNYNSYLDE